MKSIDIKIEGMHCEGCSTRLEKILNNIEGVNASVSLENKCANIEYIEEMVSIEDIKNSILDAGFEVVE